jgi:hypothetical protein
MSTNLALNNDLIESAKTLGKHRSKKEAVTVALEEYVQRLRQQDVIGAFGTIDYDKGFSHKRQRKVR